MEGKPYRSSITGVIRTQELLKPEKLMVGVFLVLMILVSKTLKKHYKFGTKKKVL
jgi:hypothetical protein